MKLIIKNPCFWILVYSILATVAIVIVSIKLRNAGNEAAAIDSDFLVYKQLANSEKADLQDKIRNYEIKIEQIDRVVDAMSDDAVRAEYERLFSK
jgi:uncharacterized protein YlxW (UPF0749 family)